MAGQFLETQRSERGSRFPEPFSQNARLFRPVSRNGVWGAQKQNKSGGRAGEVALYVAICFLCFDKVPGATIPKTLLKREEN